MRKSYTGNLNETKSSLSVHESLEQRFGNFSSSEVPKPTYTHRLTYQKKNSLDVVMDTSNERSTSTVGIQENDYRATSESGMSQVSKNKKPHDSFVLRDDRSVSKASRNTRKEESSSTSLNMEFNAEDKDEESFDHEDSDNQADQSKL